MEGLFLEKWKNTSVILGAGISLVISIISLGISCTLSFIGMIFQGGEDGLRTCFFNTMYFESVTNSDGTITMGIGLTGDYFPFLFWLGIVFLFCFGVFYFSKTLLIYRQKLIDEKNA